MSAVWKGRLIETAIGAAVFLVVVGSADPWAWVLGVAIAAGAVALCGRTGSATQHRAGERGRRSPGRPLARLVARNLRDLAVGSWKIGLAALGLRAVPEGAWVEVELVESPRTDPAALALIEAASPGTYLIRVEPERGVLVFHVFDRADAGELRRRHALALGEEGPER